MEAKDDCKDKPTTLIVLGMAGSGKTTFVHRLSAHLNEECEKPPYLINLDPAVANMPYPVNLDIQDTVNYKEVMKEYNLGPNGGIMTSLNLFAIKFDQVMNLLNDRATSTNYFITDTPGQIEVFTWSSSGTIITESLASSFPTVIIYVMDTARCVSPVTFMSNMLYACSILYKTKLPFIVVMNKTDVVDHKFAVEWTRDFEKFEAALNNDDSYSSVLSRSMSLVLDEFYEHLTLVGFSSSTGDGMEELLKAIETARQEYITDYKPEYDELKRKANEKSQKANTSSKASSSSAIVVTPGTEDKSENYKDEDDKNHECEQDVESLQRYMDKNMKITSQQK